MNQTHTQKTRIKPRVTLIPDGRQQLKEDVFLAGKPRPINGAIAFDMHYLDENDQWQPIQNGFAIAADDVYPLLKMLMEFINKEMPKASKEASHD